MDLHSRSHLGQRHATAVIAHKASYPADALPDDAALLSDLAAALDAYDRYLEGAAPASGLAAPPGLGPRAGFRPRT